jgi:hypothetical protein
MTPHWNKWAPLNAAVIANLIFKTMLTEYPNWCGVTDVPHSAIVKKEITVYRITQPHFPWL